MNGRIISRIQIWFWKGGNISLVKFKKRKKIPKLFEHFDELGALGGTESSRKNVRNARQAWFFETLPFHILVHTLFRRSKNGKL